MSLTAGQKNDISRLYEISPENIVVLGADTMKLFLLVFLKVLPVPLIFFMQKNSIAAKECRGY
jgi:hypothetical protein